MHNMALRLQPTALAKPLGLLKQMPLLEGMPGERTAAPPVLLKALALPHSPLALVRRPIALLRKHMPAQARARASGSGTQRRGRASAAMSASRTSIQRAATASEGRARSDHAIIVACGGSECRRRRYWPQRCNRYAALWTGAPRRAGLFSQPAIDHFVTPSQRAKPCFGKCSPSG